MICTDDEDIYNNLRLLRGHGLLRESLSESYKETYIKRYSSLNPDFIFPIAGFNVRNNEIGGVIGLSQLIRLDDNIRNRNENFNYFTYLLNDKYKKYFRFEVQSNYALNLVLKSQEPELWKILKQRLKNEGIEYRVGSAGGGNQLRQPYLEDYIKSKAIDPSSFKNCDHIHYYGMYIGNYPELSKNDIEYITRVINNVYSCNHLRRRVARELKVIGENQPKILAKVQGLHS